MPAPDQAGDRGLQLRDRGPRTARYPLHAIPLEEGHEADSKARRPVRAHQTERADPLAGSERARIQNRAYAARGDEPVPERQDRGEVPDEVDGSLQTREARRGSDTRGSRHGAGRESIE